MIKFAILTNNFAVSTSKMRPKIEGFMISVAETATK